MFYMLTIVFFFFKQKTAYEMRISDWSSDVCSSDLGFGIGTVFGVGDEAIAVAVHGREVEAGVGAGLGCADLAVDIGVEPAEHLARGHLGMRSEEHTSELQSLMRISYAVFCLKLKKKKKKCTIPTP